MPINKIVLVLCSVLGLISCNSDKIQTKADEWPTPEILVSSRSGETFSTKSDEDIEQNGLSNLDRLEFKFSDDKNENDALLNEIESLSSQARCFLPNNKEYSVSKTFRNKTSLLVTQTLPNQIVLSEFNGFDCDITIVLKNSIGSTRTYNLRRSKVFVQKNINQLRLVDKNQNTITSFEPTNGEGQNNYLALLPKKLEGTWRLVCEHFTSTTEHSPHKQMDLLQLMQLNPVVESTDEYAMEQNPVQRCQIEFETTHGELLTSTVFQAVVSYLMLPAQIVRNFSYEPHNINFGNYILTNPYPFSLIISVDLTSYARLEANYMVPSAYTSSGYTIQFHTNETLSWNLINPQEVKLLNSNPMTIEIPAGAQAQFHLKATTAHCNDRFFRINVPENNNFGVQAHLTDIVHAFQQDTIHFNNISKHSGISSKVKVDYTNFDGSFSEFIRHNDMYRNKQYTKPVKNFTADPCR